MPGDASGKSVVAEQWHYDLLQRLELLHRFDSDGNDSVESIIHRSGDAFAHMRKMLPMLTDREILANVLTNMLMGKDEFKTAESSSENEGSDNSDDSDYDETFGPKDISRFDEMKLSTDEEKYSKAPKPALYSTPISEKFPSPTGINATFSTDSFDKGSKLKSTTPSPQTKNAPSSSFGWKAGFLEKENNKSMSQESTRSKPDSSNDKDSKLESTIPSTQNAPSSSFGWKAGFLEKSISQDSARSKSDSSNGNTSKNQDSSKVPDIKKNAGPIVSSEQTKPVSQTNSTNHTTTSTERTNNSRQTARGRAAMTSAVQALSSLLTSHLLQYVFNDSDSDDDDDEDEEEEEVESVEDDEDEYEEDNEDEDEDDHDTAIQVQIAENDNLIIRFPHVMRNGRTVQITGEDALREDRIRELGEQGVPHHLLQTTVEIVHVRNFVVASHKGNLTKMKQIYSNYPPLNINDIEAAYERNALHCAVSNNHVSIIEWLIEIGADINCEDVQHGAPPLVIAIAMNHIDTAKRLLDAGANVNGTADDGQNSLMLLLVNNRSDLFIPDLYSDEDDRTHHHHHHEEEEDEDNEDDKRKTSDSHNYKTHFKPMPAALLPPDQDDAVSHEYHQRIVGANCGLAIDGELEQKIVDAMHMLLAYGIDINHTDRKGKTIVHYAVENASYWMMHVLLTYQPMTSLSSFTGSPLLHAIVEHDLPKVQLLITQGECAINHIPICLQIGEGSYTTALIFAMKCGFTCIIMYLLNHVPRMDINAKDFHQGTALMEAVKKGEGRIVEHMIVEKHANVRCVDNSGFTVFDYATPSMKEVIQQAVQRVEVRRTPNHGGNNRKGPRRRTTNGRKKKHNSHH